MKVSLLPGTAVNAALGVQKSARHEYVANGTLTRPLKISTRCARWPSNEIEAIVAARIAGKTDDDIKRLVAQLHAARAQSGQDGVQQ